MFGLGGLFRYSDRRLRVGVRRVQDNRGSHEHGAEDKPPIGSEIEQNPRSQGSPNNSSTLKKVVRSKFACLRVGLANVVGVFDDDANEKAANGIG